MTLGYIKNDGGRLQEYNLKDTKKNQVGDCVARSIAITLKQSYKQTLKELCQLAMQRGGMPNDRHIYDEYLFARGWKKNKPFRNANNRKLELGDLPLQEDALVLTSGHLTAVVDGCVQDTWDCREWCANSYYTKEKA